MLRGIAQQLDLWIADRNVEAREDGLATFEPCTIRVLGQSALMEAKLPVTLLSTKDVDVRADYAYPVQKEFERLLTSAGRVLDPLGHEAWMPRETRYLPIYGGRFVKLCIAEPEAVLVSKALKAPVKNRALVTEYLATCVTERFLTLAAKYSLNLEQFL